MVNQIMKALVLCGGRGIRLKPLTNTIAKQLIPVANKPILYYVLDNIKQAGIHDIGIIVSAETGQNVKDVVGDGSRWDANITFILQDQPLGLAHAVKTAREFLGESPFLMFLGDNLIEGGISEFIDRFNSKTSEAMILLKKVSEPGAFGVVTINENGNVIKLVEKPSLPESDLALVGVYLFNSSIHDAINQIMPSKRGELEITDAIQKLIDFEKKVDSHILEGWWLDTGKKDNLLEANRVVLNDYLETCVCGDVDESSEITGKVFIGKDSVIVNSRINGPVSIADGCRITNSIIGPFTSIGERTIIESSSIDHSVILSRCRICGVERLIDSVIGMDTEIKKQEGNFQAASFFVGDNARIAL